MIYYAITPTFSTVTRYVKEGEYNSVYNIIKGMTDDMPHEVAEDASSWCELAYVGAIYEHDKFTIEIIED